MNKKFTFMVAALLAAGSFSANAADNFKLKADAEALEAGKLDGKQVFLVVDDDATIGNEEFAIGLIAPKEETAQMQYTVASYADGEFGDENNANTEVSNYLWTIKEVKENGDPYVAFVNSKTGKYLAFKNGELAIVKESTAADAEVYFSYDEDDLKNKKLTLTSKTTTKRLNATKDAISLGESGVSLYAHIAAPAQVSAATLNAQFATSGFSLAPVTETKDENNIFAQQIKAITFEKCERAKTNEVIPAGTYFVVSGPSGIMNDKDGVYSAPADQTDEAKVNDYFKAFEACTFIAVSSYDRYEAVEEGDEAKNLKFITIKGSELILDEQTEEQSTQKNQIYAGNAIFVVTENDPFLKEGEYTITMPEARIKNVKDDKQAKVSLTLGVTEFSDVNYVTTVAADKATTFKHTASPLVKAISLLKTKKEASVYTIKFVSGKNATVSEYGKLLGSAVVSANTTKLVAQGSALADASLPQYQFVVSAVDTENQTLTFTNIETGVAFTTSLHSTDVENQYKLVATNSAEFNVADESSEVATDYTLKPFENTIVELTPVTVNTKAGFLQKGIDNNDTYRLAFSKNATATTRVYIAKDGDNYYNSGSYYYKETKLSEKESLQVVFEPVVNTNNAIIVNKKPSTFAYNQDDAVYKSSADLVTYNTYRMRVVDEEGLYLNYITYTGAGYVNTDVQLVNEEDASAYVVKENTDGSVSLVISDVTNDLDADVLDINDQALSVRYYAGIDPYYSAKKAYLVPNQENNGENLLSLFLEEEKVGVSLAAKSGHFTFEAENGGFVNVNDKNEGVIAISTEAGEDLTFWLDTTDSEKIIPSFYISKGGKFLYNATDSANVNKLEVNPYRLASGEPKAIFKAGTLVSSDTLSVTVDNKKATVAKEADQNKGILGGLNSFKYQVVKPNDVEDNYVVRNANTSSYLTNINGMLAFTFSKDQALRVIVEGASAPTSNESVAASEVKVIANNGSINVKNAAGKNVVVSTILGQVVANEVLTSDNATINVPAGIVVVAVEGESFKVNVK